MQQRYLILILSAGLALPGCKKYLRMPVSESVSSIDSLVNCENLANQYPLFGEQFISLELSADNYYVPDNNIQDITPLDWRIYSWDPKIFDAQESSLELNKAYEQINDANEIIQALPGIRTSPAEQARRDQVEGTAHFHRAHAFYNMLQLFAKPYDPVTAAHDWGIPLKLTPDFHEVLVRASVADSYAQVISDLQLAAAKLRPLPAGNNRNIPSRIAAWALMARMYQTMRKDSMALLYADSCLQQYPFLLDYNDCVGLDKPFADTNPEVIFQAYMPTHSRMLSIIRRGVAVVDSDLYASYATNDLRAELYYRQQNKKVVVNASYTGGLYYFSGLATDEIYLIRAECRARLGQYTAAWNDLQTLLRCRYRKGTYYPVQLVDEHYVLQQILTERRKELAFRGLRWSDLRRLNTTMPGQTMQRLVNGKTYVLKPGDIRYVFPFPDDALAGTTMPQNPRQ
jgi:hypothetical protein